MKKMNKLQFSHIYLLVRKRAPSMAFSAHLNNQRAA